MSNIFERLAKVSRSTVERVHGKDVTIFPISAKDPNASRRLSSSEASYLSSACFFENTLIENDAKAQPLTGMGRLANRALQIQASIRLIDGMPLRPGFFLRREEDGAIFSISRFDPDGLGTVLAVLVTEQALPEA
ncbi:MULTISPECIES: hypothetical protein [unclassified Rhizobium]|uniref:hypothetical protein n=1 Tax=unclassified Rhizobium TaxID=2613769 RepID=UPI00146D6E57|nr:MULTISPECIES: hypothetical protein [unclassified Rhizobium]MBD9445764.1 hypothetical protein [Rhizobium sp. RHZ01]NMN73865.1 hypothetical protein [Rhizobium sp. 57MFTsu3.2]